MNDLRSDLAAAFPRLRWVVTAIGVLVAVFLLVPLLVILPAAFSADEFLTFPPVGFSSEWFIEAFTDPRWRDAALVSLQTASVATLAATVAGTAAAFAVRGQRRWRRATRTLLLAPLVVPPLVIALGLTLAATGLGTRAGLGMLVLGQATLAAPLVYLTVTAGLAAVDPALSRASASLGHGWASTLLRVELPLVARSVIGAAVLAFGLCFDESVLAYYLSPPGQETLPTAVWLSASQSASPVIAAVSTLVMGLAVALLGLMFAVTGTRRRAS